MLQEVRATITKYLMFSPGDRVLVGVSGGPDSVALLHVLHELSEELQITVFVAHLNHCFRGEESARDADFVRDLAADFGIEAVIGSEDVAAFALKRKLSAQTAAREVRYRFFEDAAKRLRCNKLATGHTANDQAETVIFNFLRGSGPAGLSGIPPVRDGWITRPLIRVTRAQVEEYCRANNLATRLDKSNLKGVYTRNRIRLQLIPLLEKEYNPNLVETLVRTSEAIRDDEIYLEELAGLAWQQVYLHGGDDRLVLNLPSFCHLPPALRKRVVRRAWAEIAGPVPGLEFVHLAGILDILEKGNTGSMLNLPQGVILRKSYDSFEFYRAKGASGVPGYAYELKIPGITAIPEIGQAIVAEFVDPAAGYAGETGNIIIDYDKVSLPLRIRTRLPGDRFWPCGMDGSQKLKKYFIDKKVSRSMRETIPVLVTGDEQVIWVVGMRADRRWQVGPLTKRALKLKIIENMQEQN